MSNTKSTLKHPKYDVELSDGERTVGLMLVDGRGQNSPTNIRRVPYPRTSTKIQSGTGKYDDFELPYKSIVQDNWIGGRGGLNLEDDTTRFLDSYRLWTEQEKQVCLSGLESYASAYLSDNRTTIHKQIESDLPGNVDFIPLHGTTKYMAKYFVPDGAYTTSRVGLIIKRVGTPGTLSIALYNNQHNPGDNPYIEITSTTITTTTECLDNTSKFYYQELAADLGSMNEYWIVVYQSVGTPDKTNHWEVGVNPDSGASTTRQSANGTDWSTASKGLYFRITDDSDFKFKLFEYKRSIYAVDYQSRGVGSKLFVNGDRGNANDNTSYKNRLVDNAKNWLTNEWAGCIVMVIKGAGASDRKSWRTIVSNTSTYCVVDEDWDTVHTTSTEYVILGSNKWTYRMTFSYAITDVAVAGDMVYFAQGSDNGIVRYAEYVSDSASAWTVSNATEDLRANKLCAINTPTGWELWGSNDNHERFGTCVWRARVPVKYSTTSKLYNLVSVLDEGKDVWDEIYDSDVSVATTDAGMTIDIPADKRYLLCSRELEATDITRANRVGVYMKSSDQLFANDIQIRLDDTQFMGRGFLPTGLIFQDNEAPPSDVVLHRSGTMPPSQIYFYDDSETDATDKWKLEYNLYDDQDAEQFTATFTTADYLYISSPDKFTGLYITIAVGNTNVSALEIEVWDGVEWHVKPAFTDGTSASSKTFNVTSGALVYWTEDTGWAPGCHYDQATYLAQDRYNMRLSFSANTTATTIARINVQGARLSKFPADYQLHSLKNTYDIIGDTYRGLDFGEWLYLGDGDNIYVSYPKPFDEMYFSLHPSYLNTVGSEMELWLWNGEDWYEMSFTDGTETAGDTLGRSGAIYWDMHQNWAPGCPKELEEYLNKNNFTVRLRIKIDSASTYRLDDIIINSIVIQHSWDIYRRWEMTNAKDGDHQRYNCIDFDPYDWLYVFFDAKYNRVNFDISETENNTATAALSAEYFNGEVWTTLTLTDDTTDTGASGKSLYTSGYVEFTIPYDWQRISLGEAEGYGVRFKVSATMTAGVQINDVTAENNDAITTIRNPTILYANKWAYFQVDISPAKNPNPDDRSIISIGIYKVGLTASAVTLTIGSIELLTDAGDYVKLGNERVNSIEAYGEERLNPWIFTESKVYEVQTENNNNVISLPLREISSIRSDINGNAHTVSDVYLVFNLDTFIEKYYQHNMDDISPSRDEGLPENRQGEPTCLMSYPGRIFLSINAGEDGFSTVMLRRSAGWHEIYRAPLGNRIWDLSLQVIPTMDTRLWISQENELLWIPLPSGTWNPIQDNKFVYSNEGMLITGWITAGFLDVKKFWKSVKLYSEDLVADEQYITCEYQEDYGLTENCTHWHPLSSYFDESPFKEVLISNEYDVTARRIRFRFKFHTTDYTKTPVMKAIVVECLLRFPVKNSFPLTFRIEDNPEDYSGKHNKNMKAEDASNILDEWANTPTVLRMRCNYSPYDNKLVVIEPLSLKPLQVDSNEVLFEKHLAQCNLLEV